MQTMAYNKQFMMPLVPLEIENIDFLEATLPLDKYKRLMTLVSNDVSGELQVRNMSVRPRGFAKKFKSWWF